MRSAFRRYAFKNTYAAAQIPTARRLFSFIPLLFSKVSKITAEVLKVSEVQKFRNLEILEISEVSEVLKMHGRGRTLRVQIFFRKKFFQE
ncbi:MAG: hypothetical protein DBX39_04695 [Bacillota bacterium]|nr:MAG: hypothetical protein DBX39_04695 [Bacillota bacterium]